MSGNFWSALYLVREHVAAVYQAPGSPSHGWVLGYVCCNLWRPVSCYETGKLCQFHSLMLISCSSQLLGPSLLEHVLTRSRGAPHACWSLEFAVCAPGWGIPTDKPDSSDPADCEPCPYGKYQAGGSLRCTDCPDTPFNHPAGDKYVSYGVSFTTLLQNPATCVPRYSQLPAPAGARLALDPSLFSTNDTSSFEDCIHGCTPDLCCIAEWVKEGSVCKWATLMPVGPKWAEDGNGALYYKLPPSSIIASASVNDSSSGHLKAKTQPAGVYTRCGMTDEWVDLAKQGKVGTSFNLARVEEANVVEWNQCTDEIACRLLCDTNAACWGFIFVPGSGFALRGGEDQIGTRTFMVSPDFAAYTTTVSQGTGRRLRTTVPNPAAGEFY